MKNFPDIVTFNKSHKKKIFKGLKASQFYIYNVGLRIRYNIYMNPIQYETMRRTAVRCLRRKRPRILKKEKSSLQDRINELPFDIKIYKKRSDIRAKYKRLSKKKKLSFRLRYHFYSPITKKPLQVRMGKGKGDPYSWVSPSPSSKMIFELSRKTLNTYKLLRYSKRISCVLPVSAKFVFNRQYLRREHNFVKFFKKEKNLFFNN